jgi:hypothetical protein
MLVGPDRDRSGRIVQTILRVPSRSSSSRRVPERGRRSPGRCASGELAVEDELGVVPFELS